MIPRIQGRVGEIESPPELAGRFTFEVFLSFMGDGEPQKVFQGPDYATHEEAMKELRNACRICCEKIETDIDGKPSGKFIDMKTNHLRSWDEN